MAWKMFKYAGIGAAGGGTVGASVGCGMAAGAAMTVGIAAAPIAIPVIVAGAAGAGIFGLGGFFVGAYKDVSEKDSEVKKTKEEKETEVDKITKEKDAKITEITQEKSDLEKNQADYAEVKKAVEDMKKTDIGQLKTENENLKIQMNSNDLKYKKSFEEQNLKIEAQELRIYKLEEEKQKLIERIENLEKENQELKKKILNLENEKAELKAKNSNLELRNSDLENQIKELKIKLENSENSKIETIQKLAINVESLIINSGNQLSFILKEIGSISKSKDGVLNILQVQQGSLQANLSKEMKSFLPNKEIQSKIQDLISIAEKFIQMERSDSSKIKNKSGEVCYSAQQIFVNLACELRDLRQQEFELTGKKPENNRISNDKDVLRFLDQWKVSTEFNLSNLNLSQINQITNNLKQEITVNN